MLTEESVRKRIDITNDRKVFVGSIPKMAKPKDIIEHFKKFGDIKEISPFFKIGKGGKICAVIEYKTKKSRDSVLNTTHCLFKRYLDCKEYMRGEKLKQHNAEMKKKNVYLKDIGPELSMEQIRSYFSKFGPITRVKVGFSIKVDCRYGIIYFKNQSTAKKVLEHGMFILEGYEVEAQIYRERIHVDIKDLNVHGKKGLLTLSQEKTVRDSPKYVQLDQRIQNKENFNEANFQKKVEASSTKFLFDEENSGRKEHFDRNQTENHEGIAEIDGDKFFPRKNSEEAMLEVKLTSLLHMRFAHTSGNLKLNKSSLKRFQRGSESWLSQYPVYPTSY